MKKFKKLICILLSLIMITSLAGVAFADDDSPENPSETSSEEIPALKSLDTSAIDGKIYAYVGEETYFVIYPEPLEAESRFDVRNAVITCSEEGIVEARPEKVEEYRFGNVTLVGIKLGKTVVTVTEPESGVSCSVEVTVLPGIIYKLINLHNFLPLVPYLLFMAIISIFNR